MATRDIEIAATSAARFRVPNGAWINVPLSALARANSVTDDRPGRDLAFVEIDVIEGTPVWVVLFDAVTAGLGDPEALVANFTNPAPVNGTKGVGLRIAGNGLLTLDKVRGLENVSLWAPLSHHSTVQISIHSYRTDTESPWADG